MQGYVWWISASKAVLASLVDSLVDLASQGVVAMTEYQSKVCLGPATPGCHIAGASASACIARLPLVLGR